MMQSPLDSFRRRYVKNPATPLRLYLYLGVTVVAAAVASLISNGAGAAVVLFGGCIGVCTYLLAIAQLPVPVQTVGGGALGTAWGFAAVASYRMGELLTFVAIVALLIVGVGLAVVTFVGADRPGRPATGNVRAVLYVGGSVALAVTLGFVVLVARGGFSEYRGGTLDALRNSASYGYVGRAIDDADGFDAEDWIAHDDAAGVSSSRGETVGRILFGEHEPRLVVTMRLLCDLDGEITGGNRTRLVDAIASARDRSFTFDVDDPEDFARIVTCNELDPLPFHIEPRSA